ncbi:nose resistant to fluoxetine protein 6-like protein [Leptotrombidium deliense]|uniref:Nose resistant to fluoxetine protein 6-like protein n=1 Tax=Leptotrombidium deliense TaxID=299467 RepID=A0A443S517_9ACAR|nr:nose resistant to fluoxetine protein 6-like protein [Leptotrombidium deliense]
MCVLDSSAKFPVSGTIEGTLGDIGRYDECLDVQNEANTISGQYCSFLLHPPLPPRPRFHTICNQIQQLLNISRPGKLFRWIAENAHYFYYVPIRLGLCTPSTCSPEDITSLLESAVKPFSLNVSLLNGKCEIKEERSLNATQIFVLYVFLV